MLPTVRRMLLGGLVALLLLSPLVPLAIAPAQDRGDEAEAGTATWDPAKTWVFAVGVIDFAGEMSGWPQEGRKDAELVAQFKARGVPAEQVVFLKDAQAKKAAITGSFAEFLPKPAADDLLVVYFTGHGSKGDEGDTCFTPYDYDSEKRQQTGWDVASIFDSIEAKFRGTRAWIMADCCYSGSLVVEANKRKESRVSWAALASSSASTTSTGNWTFTECVLAGVSGSPRLDLNRDGKLMLGEIAAFTEAEMAFVDQQLSTFGTTGSFPPRLVMATAGEKLHPRIGRRVMAKSGGHWYRAIILDVKDGKFLVHYPGWSSDDDEWLPQGKLRPWRPRHFDEGTEVEVRWSGTWYPAKVLDAKLGLHLITYDGYSEVWDEWVAPDRIRLRDGGDGPPGDDSGSE